MALHGNILKSKEYSDAVFKIPENNKSIDRINTFIKSAIDNNIGFILIPVKFISTQSLKMKIPIENMKRKDYILDGKTIYAYNIIALNENWYLVKESIRMKTYQYEPSKYA